MSTSYQFALSNPVAGMESEFNEWYGGPHLDHGLETPGVLAGQRFKRAPGPWPAGKHDYLMLWEFDDPAFALEEVSKVKNTDQMPISPAIDMAGVQPPTMWRRAHIRSKARIPTNTATRGSIVFALFCAKEGQDDAFQHVLMTEGLADIADTSGVVSADFMTLADEQIRGNCRKFPFGLLIEVYDEEAALRGLKSKLQELPHQHPDKWQAVLFQPLGPRKVARVNKGNSIT